MIKVRLATSADHDALIGFIHDHWSASHVFTQAPEVFRWQHLQSDGRLNVMFAEQITDGEREIVGFLGFIPTGRFDTELGDTDLTLAIWMVRDGAPPGLGLRLLKQLRAELQPRLIAAIGISEMVGPIYKVLRYELGRLDHVAIFNPARNGKLRLADNVPASAFVAADDRAADGGIVRLERLNSDSDETTRRIVDQIGAARVPAKSWTYVRERYLEHPWYRYIASLVCRDELPVAVMVWRRVEAEGTAVLRIVDIIGDTGWLADANIALTSAVIDADAEYIDLMSFGVDRATLAAGGFVSPSEHPDMIIPNYFSPFERRNVDVALAITCDDEDVTLFRADSDQDRPNSLNDLTG